MIVRPYISVGNMVLYSPPGRDDMQISVRIEEIDPLVGVWIEYADKSRALVDMKRLSAMPESRMRPVASIRQPLEYIVDEFAAAGGSVEGFARWKRKHGLG